MIVNNFNHACILYCHVVIPHAPKKKSPVQAIITVALVRTDSKAFGRRFGLFLLLLLLCTLGLEGEDKWNERIWTGIAIIAAKMCQDLCGGMYNVASIREGANGKGRYFKTISAVYLISQWEEHVRRCWWYQNEFRARTSKYTGGQIIKWNPGISSIWQSANAA